MSRSATRDDGARFERKVFRDLSLGSARQGGGDSPVRAGNGRQAPPQWLARVPAQTCLSPQPGGRGMGSRVHTPPVRGDRFPLCDPGRALSPTSGALSRLCQGNAGADLHAED